MKKRKMTLLGVSLLLSAFLLTLYPTSYVNANNSERIFTDVNTSDWFYDDVQFVNENNLMTGTNKNTFSPSAATTRGMIVTILWRNEGNPLIEEATFDDIKKDDYYYNAVIWASKNEIVKGYNQTTFAPNDVATREQLATIIYRYAAYKNYDLSKKSSLSEYKDEGFISDYALPAIQWANANGILTGTSGHTLSPTEYVPRCQVAAILRRFISFSNETTEDLEASTNNGTTAATGGSSSSKNDSESPSKEEASASDSTVDAPTIKVHTVYGAPGEVITVPLDLRENPGILGMILHLVYDETAMTLIAVENGDAVKDSLSLTPSATLESGVTFVWDGLNLDSNDIKDGTLLTLTFQLSDHAIIGKRYPLMFRYTVGDIVDVNLNAVSPIIKQGFIEIE